MRRAIVTLLTTTRLLAEGAGAAALAAAEGMREQLEGKKVALVLSGGNLTVDGLRRALAEIGESREANEVGGGAVA